MPGDRPMSLASPPHLPSSKRWDSSTQFANRNVDHWSITGVRLIENSQGGWNNLGDSIYFQFKLFIAVVFSLWLRDIFSLGAVGWGTNREGSCRKHWAPQLSLIHKVRALIPGKHRFVANDSRRLNLARDKWPWDRMCSVSCQLLRSMPHFSYPSHLAGLALITLPSCPPSKAGWREGTRPLTLLLRKETHPKDYFNALSITFNYFNHIPLANNVNCLSFTVCHQSQQLSNAFSHQFELLMSVVG